MRTSISTTSAGGRAQHLQRRAAVLRLAGHLDVGLRVEHHAEPRAYELLVVDEQHPDAHVLDLLFHREACDDLEAAAGGGLGAYGAAVDGDALAHAHQAVAAAVAGVVAPAVVADPDLDRVVTVVEPDLGGGARPGVLEGVGEGLLDDPVDRELHARGQLGGHAVDRQVDRQPGRADLLDQLGELVDARLRREGGLAVLAQHPEHAAHLRERLPPGRADRLHRALGPLRVGVDGVARRRRPGRPSR